MICNWNLEPSPSSLFYGPFNQNPWHGRISFVEHQKSRCRFIYYQFFATKIWKRTQGGLLHINM